MSIDSLSKKQFKIKIMKVKKHQPKKWLAVVFIVGFCLSSAGFVQMGLAEEETSDLNASSTPETLLPADESGNESDNASSSPVTEPLLETPVLDSNASSTPETIDSYSLTNASSTEANGSSTAPVTDTLIPNVSSIVPNDVA